MSKSWSLGRAVRVLSGNELEGGLSRILGVFSGSPAWVLANEHLIIRVADGESCTIEMFISDNYGNYYVAGVQATRCGKNVAFVPAGEAKSHEIRFYGSRCLSISFQRHKEFSYVVPAVA